MILRSERIESISIQDTVLQIAALEHVSKKNSQQIQKNRITMLFAGC
ncbi:hypothetical protein LEP1GSC040_0729 [Leptospira santarosai str. 2000030832]|nr:hypothetical protein LEP1GSC040_0729 [Leptospira santarosai str. 2000030832]